MNGKNKAQLLPLTLVHDLLHDPAFSEVVEHCLKEEELVTQFCRLYEMELPRKPRNGLEAMVDEVTGYRADTFKKFFAAFIPFVHRAVYLPLRHEFESKENKNGSAD